MPRTGPPVLFRDSQGRFLPHRERYTDKVVAIDRKVYGGYVTVADHAVSPGHLATLLSQREFESLGEATKPIGSYKSSSKYKAWDIAEQIDQTRGIRRKSLKLTMVLDDNGRECRIEIYHKIKGNTESSYRIFQRFNEEVGFEGFYLYKTAGGKVIADRRGKQVKLKRVDVEEVL